MKTDISFINRLSENKKNPHLISLRSIYSLFEVKRNSEYYFDGECHTPWEMVYVIEGTIGITADDRIYTLSAGDVVFHKPMEFHKIWYAAGTTSHYLICSFDLEGSLSHILRDSVFHLSDEAKTIISLLITYLHGSFNSSSKDMIDYYELIDKNSPVLQSIFNFLELFFMSISSSKKRESYSSPNTKMQLYTEIAGILEEHVYDKITISEIAKECNVSTATVKNCFAEYAGCGIHKYFLNIKIRTAIDMLKKGMTVSEVSDALQFANPNYFSYVFKRETGTCASSYKK